MGQVKWLFGIAFTGEFLKESNLFSFVHVITPGLIVIGPPKKNPFESQLTNSRNYLLCLLFISSLIIPPTEHNSTITVETLICQNNLKNQQRSPLFQRPVSNGALVALSSSLCAVASPRSEL